VTFAPKSCGYFLSLVSVWFQNQHHLDPIHAMDSEVKFQILCQ
jgi:uncharacterized membrane protein